MGSEMCIRDRNIRGITRTIYNANEASAYAERCRLYRQRKNAVVELKQCILSGNQGLEDDTII